MKDSIKRQKDLQCFSLRGMKKWINEDLKSHFLNQETRDGFFMSANLKEVLKVELDELETFVTICKRHGLRYMLIGGTLIGAMRHKGYIPWDDDIDVAMPREDYDKFMRIAPKELPQPLFLQNQATDPEYRWGFAKIRNSETAAIHMPNVEWKLRSNQGIFIDIFPLDNMPSTEKSKHRLFRKIYLWNVLHEAAYSRVHVCWKVRLIRPFVRIIYKLLGRKLMYWLRENPMRKCPPSDEVYVGGFLNEDASPRIIYKSKWVKDVVEVPFEYMMLMAPEHYDEVLTSEYGDWRTPVRGAAAHQGLLFDVHRSYRDILVEKYGYQKETFNKV